MGFLLDSNAVIDFIGARLPVPGHSFLSNVVPVISVITRIEIFSSPKIPSQERKAMLHFVSVAKIIDVIDMPSRNRPSLFANSKK